MTAKLGARPPGRWEERLAPPAHGYAALAIAGQWRPPGLLPHSAAAEGASWRNCRRGLVFGLRSRRTSCGSSSLVAAAGTEAVGSQGVCRGQTLHCHRCQCQAIGAEPGAETGHPAICSSLGHRRQVLLETLEAVIQRRRLERSAGACRLLQLGHRDKRRKVSLGPR